MAYWCTKDRTYECDNCGLCKESDCECENCGEKITGTCYFDENYDALCEECLLELHKII